MFTVVLLIAQKRLPCLATIFYQPKQQISVIIITSIKSVFILKSLEEISFASCNKSLWVDTAQP